MAKKPVKRVHHHKPAAVKAKPAKKNDFLVWVKGWMFVVAFALMLGVGAIVGTYFNTLMNESTPTVAGVQTEIAR
jgi:hypothetical protein